MDSCNYCSPNIQKKGKRTMTFKEWHIDMYCEQLDLNQDFIKYLEEEYKEWCYINGLAPIWD